MLTIYPSVLCSAGYVRRHIGSTPLPCTHSVAVANTQLSLLPPQIAGSDVIWADFTEVKDPAFTESCQVEFCKKVQTSC